MRYIITGGAGFIGSHLTEALLKQGHEVVVIDNFSTGRRENLQAVMENPKLRIVEDDVVEPSSAFSGLLATADVIVHLAAAVGVELVVRDPVRTITTNVRGSENVLKVAVENKIRILVASTSEVYGKSGKEFFSESDDLLIGPPTHSRWSYAASKLLDEFYVTAYHRAAGLPGTVVRFFNTVGPRQIGRYGMVLPRFVERALRGEALEVYGSGDQTRCFCHVRDVVRALTALAVEPESYGKIYNIGSTRRISIRKLAEMVIARSGSTSAIASVSYEKAYEKGFEDMMNRAPNTGAIRALINWEPECSLEGIIDDVIAEKRCASQGGR